MNRQLAERSRRGQDLDCPVATQVSDAVTQ